MAWKLIHGVFRKGKPVPPTRRQIPPRSPKKSAAPQPSPPKEKKEEPQKETLTIEQIQELIANGNKDLKKLLEQLLQQKPQVTVVSPVQEKKSGFKAVEIDETIANVTKQEELEGQVELDEALSEDDPLLRAARLKKMLSKK